MAIRESRIGAAILPLLLALPPSPLLAAPPFSEWSPAVNLGSPINSAFNESGPALSKDRLSLYFASDRPGGLGGSDIWVVQRASREAPWGEPANLGPTINTAFNEEVPFFSRDGHVMFFNSVRSGGVQLYEHLTGMPATEGVAIVTGPQAVHDMYVAAPGALLEAIAGTVSLP